MDDDAIDEAFETGKFFDTVSVSFFIFKKLYLINFQVLLAERDKKSVFEDVRNRHADIIKLEASIRELHEIFQDMNMLIGCQVNFCLLLSILNIQFGS